jgi:flagellar motility protein MotE (MotC chaperone)
MRSFDLKKDPAERRAWTDAASTTACDRLLHELRVRKAAKRSDTSGSERVSAETRERLRALGYLD